MRSSTQVLKRQTVEAGEICNKGSEKGNGVARAMGGWKEGGSRRRQGLVDSRNYGEWS